MNPIMMSPLGSVKKYFQSYVITKYSRTFKTYDIFILKNIFKIVFVSHTHTHTHTHKVSMRKGRGEGR